jgi:hypothetical protein
MMSGEILKDNPLKRILKDSLEVLLLQMIIGNASRCKFATSLFSFILETAAVAIKLQPRLRSSVGGRGRAATRASGADHPRRHERWPARSPARGKGRRHPGRRRRGRPISSMGRRPRLAAAWKGGGASVARGGGLEGRRERREGTWGGEGPKLQKKYKKYLNLY